MNFKKNCHITLSSWNIVLLCVEWTENSSQNHLENCRLPSANLKIWNFLWIFTWLTGFLQVQPLLLNGIGCLFLIQNRSRENALKFWENSPTLLLSRKLNKLLEFFAKLPLRFYNDDITSGSLFIFKEHQGKWKTEMVFYFKPTSSFQHIAKVQPCYLFIVCVKLGFDRVYWSGE